jgi:tetratricopeptide (TPR) repeat protein
VTVRERAPLALIGIAALALACATYSDHLRVAHAEAERGDWSASEARLERVLGVDSRDELPETWNSETTLAVLERAMVLQAQGAWAESARDLSAAETELELIDLQLDTPGKIGSYIYSDSAEEYRAPPIERMALNAFNMMNYLALDQLRSAGVEARRYQVMRDYLEQVESHPHGRFGAYLAGFVFEHLGEWERALRYYEDALEDGPLESLRAPVARTAARSSWRGPEVEKSLARSASAAGPGEVPAELLVVLNLGRTPIKVPKRIPVGAAVGIAGTFITGDPRVLERSVLKVVVYPELEPVPSRVTAGRIRVDGRDVQPELLNDLAAEVRREYEKLKPRIIGAALTRMIARALAAEGARAAARKAGGEVVGILVALGTEAALVGLDKPDTRSWTFLPGRVLVARVPVPPGEHTVRVDLSGRGGGSREVPVSVAAGSYAAVVVTEPR